MMYAQTFSNRSFINCIVAYADIREIYIFIIREQHELGFICIDAKFSLISAICQCHDFKTVLLLFNNNNLSMSRF